MCQQLLIFACANVQRVADVHPRNPVTVNNENGICSWYAYILNDINDINNGYIGGACPYKNNGFGGGDGHAPHICRCENQLVVALLVFVIFKFLLFYFA